MRCLWSCAFTSGHSW